MKLALGIDVGGTNTKIVLASDDGSVLNSVQVPTPAVPAGSAVNMDDLLIKSARDFLDSNATKTAVKRVPGNAAIVGIGIGVAGIIDRKKGIVIQSPNISAMNGLPLRDNFEKEFSLPVIVENDANTYAFGEKWVGSGKNLDNFVLLTLGTGLGGGIIYKGELFEAPVEIGHMTIVPSGRYCTCGGYGCLESYASGRAIVDRAISSLEKGAESLLLKCCDGNIYKVTSQVIFETALEGDSLSREIFREVGHFLGIGIANLINILGIEAVIIGGGLVGAWDMFIDELKKETQRRAFKPLSTSLQVLKSSLTRNAGSIGAAGFLLKKVASVHESS